MLVSWKIPFLTKPNHILLKQHLYLVFLQHKNTKKIHHGRTLLHREPIKNHEKIHLHVPQELPPLLLRPFPPPPPLRRRHPPLPSPHRLLLPLPSSLRPPPLPLPCRRYPPQSELFAILNLKLSQTLLSYIFLLPFSLSFLLLSKAAIIKLLHHEKNYEPFSWISTLNRLISTQICSSLVILSANATCFSLLAVAFNFSDVLGFQSPRFRLLLSATGAIVYSIVLANAYVICGLAVIMSAAEGCRGFASILKACVAVRGRTAVALSLAVPMNMALAAVEALFQYRLVGAYNRGVVAYMYAVVVVIDTVVGYVLLRSCREDYQIPLRLESLKEGKALDSAL